MMFLFFFFFSSRRRHTRSDRDWSSDVCSSDLLGLGHVTISDGASDARIRQNWEVAQRPNHATVFLVHTHSLRKKEQLDWFLDLVAAAQTRGTVRLVASAQDLFGASSARAPQSLDSIPGAGTGTQIYRQTP